MSDCSWEADVVECWVHFAFVPKGDLPQEITAMVDNRPLLKWSRKTPFSRNSGIRRHSDIWRHSDIYFHAEIAAGSADKAAADRYGLANVACDGNPDQILAAGRAVRRIIRDPPGAGNVDATLSQFGVKAALGSLRVGFETHACLAMRRESSMTEAA
jgi:hypothetical protein